mmetsp:Transcript_39589/g.104920  ORF Transcript_39589/g.104920 Transcript_39589/m.104920 type:complete len:224 (-) Transcript_39589:123-794(-)
MSCIPETSESEAAFLVTMFAHDGLGGHARCYRDAQLLSSGEEGPLVLHPIIRLIGNGRVPSCQTTIHLPEGEPILRCQELLPISGARGVHAPALSASIQGRYCGHSWVPHEQEQIPEGLRLYDDTQRQSSSWNGDVAQVLPHVQMERAAPVMRPAPDTTHQREGERLQTRLLPVRKVTTLLQTTPAPEVPYRTVVRESIRQSAQKFLLSQRNHQPRGQCHANS